MKEAGVWTVGLTGDSAKRLDQVDLTVPTALVLGAEGTGLRRLVRDHCDWLASIPMRGHVQSLNVSVAAGMHITRALVLSQVVLSLVLPTPMVALVRFTASREVMGEFANSRLINALAIAATGFVSLLNGILLLAIAGLPIPFAGA